MCVILWFFFFFLSIIISAHNTAVYMNSLLANMNM